jgi:hypothetical protein
MLFFHPTCNLTRKKFPLLLGLLVKLLNLIVLLVVEHCGESGCNISKLQIHCLFFKKTFPFYLSLMNIVEII